ncbi:MAG TPA: PspC domain-containing protein [Actinomycetales bacterium]|nr:PspC domain-containing protein [Actinomycetales bacterium]
MTSDDSAGTSGAGSTGTTAQQGTAGPHDTGGQPGEPGQPGPSGATAFFDTLRRSPVVRSDDRWLGGVCAGLAEKLCIDPVVVRVAVLVISLIGGVPAILYGLAWLALPGRTGRVEAEAAVRGDVSGSAVVAGLLVLLPGLLPRPWQWWWPGADPAWHWNPGAWLVAIAVAVGALVWVSQGGRWRAVVGESSSQTGVSSSKSATASAPAASAAPRSDAPTAPTATHAGTAAPVAPAVRRRGPGVAVSSAAIGVALVAAGGAALWAIEGGLDMPARLAAATAAALVLGLVTIALGVGGRTDGTVGFLGFVAAVSAVAMALIPASANVRAGDYDWTTTSVRDAEAGYVLLFGDGTVDLTGLNLDAATHGPVVVPVKMGFGSMRVIVPEDVPVTVRSRVVVGDSVAGSGAPSGWQASGTRTGIGASTTAKSSGSVDSRLVVELQGLAGDLSVEVAR